MGSENSLVSALNVNGQPSWQGEGWEHLKWKLFRVTLCWEADTLNCKQPAPETPSSGNTACTSQHRWSPGPLLSSTPLCWLQREMQGFQHVVSLDWLWNKDYERCSNTEGDKGHKHNWGGGGEIPKFLESSRCFQSMSPITDDTVSESRLLLTVTFLGPLDGETDRSFCVWTWIWSQRSNDSQLSLRQPWKGLTAGPDDMLIHPRTRFQPPLGWAPRWPSLG